MFLRLPFALIVCLSSVAVNAETYIARTQGILYYQAGKTYHMFSHSCPNQERPLPALVDQIAGKKLSAYIFKRGKTKERDPVWVEVKAAFFPAGEDIKTNHETFALITELIKVDGVRNDPYLCEYEKT